MKKGACLFIWMLAMCFSHFALMNQPLAMEKGGAAMELTSSAFIDGEMIPRKFSCDGADVSPGLAWHNVPAGTKSFALICDDPDAPMGTWVHWVYYDIPAETRALAKDIPPEEHPDTGGKQGVNDFRKIGYGGPCPPGGPHRYHFKLYALDVMLNLAPGATKRQLLKKIEGHVLGRAKLMGRYKR